MSRMSSVQPKPKFVDHVSEPEGYGFIYAFGNQHFYRNAKGNWHCMTDGVWKPAPIPAWEISL